MSKLDLIKNPCEKHANVTVTGSACVSCMGDRIAEVEAELAKLANCFQDALDQRDNERLKCEVLAKKLERHDKLITWNSWLAWADEHTKEAER